MWAVGGDSALRGGGGVGGEALRYAGGCLSSRPSHIPAGGFDEQQRQQAGSRI